jgi:hypothetical protein
LFYFNDYSTIAYGNGTVMTKDIKAMLGLVLHDDIVSSAGGREFVPRSGPTKDNEVGICYFSAKHGTLRRKS